MKSKIALFWIRYELLWIAIHLIQTATSAEFFAELYKTNCKFNTSSIAPAHMKTTPSLLSCTHACVRCEGCTVFNYCSGRMMKHNCEMFDLEINDNSFMNDGHLNDIIPDNECSIYTLLKKIPFQKVSVAFIYLPKRRGKGKECT